MKWVSQIITAISFLISLSLLIFMIKREASRYISNEDVSSSSFRQFNSLPSDKYPAYTLCFHKSEIKNKHRRGIFFTRRHLTEQDNTDKSKLYWKIFTGEDVKNISKYHDVKKEDVEKIRNRSDFSALTMDLEEMANSFKVANDEYVETDKWELKTKTRIPSDQNRLISTTNSTYWPFYVSYMNPERKCFTRKVDFQKNVIKKYERIILNRQILNQMTVKGDARRKISGTLMLTVTIHHPRHFVRSFETGAHFITPITKGLHTRLNIRVFEVKVIKGRHDANTKCNPTADDQDQILMKSVIKKMGCIPPYWKTLMKENNPNISFCETSKQLEKAYKYTAYSKDFRRLTKIILENENVPCTQTQIASYVEPWNGHKENLRLYIYYNEGLYTETRNSKAYLIQDLLSSAGGYIGMFLGFGLLQIPEIVSALYGLCTQTVPGIAGRRQKHLGTK